jgi:purine-binding chemotaxis protein CheW
MSVSLQEALAGAAAQPRETAAKADELELMSFRVMQDYFAVPTSHVAEVLSHKQATPVPHVEAHIKGVINSRGKVTAVLDLASLLDRPPEAAAKRMLVLTAGDLEAAVPISEILGIFSTPRAALDVEAAQGSLVRGRLQQGEHVLVVLDVAAVLQGGRHEGGGRL